MGLIAALVTICFSHTTIHLWYAFNVQKTDLMKYCILIFDKVKGGK